MKKIIDVRRTLAEHKAEIMRRFHVGELGIFGSYAQGKAGSGSDLDVLVAYRTAPGIFKFIELEDYLTELTGIKVDLVTKSGLKPGIRERVLHEVVAI